MTDIAELIERVEKAGGPDRNLDYMLHTFACGGVGQGAYGSHPEFTASVDAALALMERLLPGWHCGLDPVFFEGDGKHRVEWDAILCRAAWAEWNPVDTRWIKRIEARHPDRIRAILLATLRAIKDNPQ